MDEPGIGKGRIGLFLFGYALGNALGYSAIHSPLFASLAITSLVGGLICLGAGFWEFHKART